MDQRMRNHLAMVRGQRDGAWDRADKLEAQLIECRNALDLIQQTVKAAIGTESKTGALFSIESIARAALRPDIEKGGEKEPDITKARDYFMDRGYKLVKVGKCSPGDPDFLAFNLGSKLAVWVERDEQDWAVRYAGLRGLTPSLFYVNAEGRGLTRRIENS